MTETDTLLRIDEGRLARGPLRPTECSLYPNGRLVLPMSVGKLLRRRARSRSPRVQLRVVDGSRLRLAVTKSLKDSQALGRVGNKRQTSYVMLTAALRLMDVPLPTRTARWDGVSLKHGEVIVDLSHLQGGGALTEQGHS